MNFFPISYLSIRLTFLITGQFLITLFNVPILPFINIELKKIILIAYLLNFTYNQLSVLIIIFKSKGLILFTFLN